MKWGALPIFRLGILVESGESEGHQHPRGLKPSPQLPEATEGLCYVPGQGFPAPGPWASTHPSPVRNQASQEEVSVTESEHHHLTSGRVIIST